MNGGIPEGYKDNYADDDGFIELPPPIFGEDALAKDIRFSLLRMVYRAKSKESYLRSDSFSTIFKEVEQLEEFVKKATIATNKSESKV